VPVSLARLCRFIQTLFDDQGQLLDQGYVTRIDQFLKELIWMAKVLRYGRENVSL